MTPRRVTLLAATLALASSGLYVFVYLYRWEWHRAIMVGVLFLATEILLVAMTFAGRLRAIGERLERQDRDARTRTAGRHLRASPPEPHAPFQWLTDDDRMGVFVPVLLGAGVVLSAIAWVIERVALITAGPALDTGLAGRLAPLCLPETGLLERAAGPASPYDPHAVPGLQ